MDRRTETLTRKYKEWDEVAREYRHRWQRAVPAPHGTWDEYEPAYRYAYEMAYHPRYMGRTWQDVEADLYAGYPSWARERGYAYELSWWDRFKENVRQTWEDIIGER